YLNGKYKHGHGIDIRLEITGEYNNSKAILEKYPRNYQILSEAFKRAQVTISPEASRGGSDANEITFMGIPTYNIFAGYVNEHSHKEWVSAIFMENSYKVILSYITLYGEHDY
ncbi:MAG: hypothetical protein LBS88_02540, partial [Tannerellaceae bacterium]|nr:hypothetical protein [Tannerellaceae bacterium]